MVGGFGGGVLIPGGLNRMLDNGYVIILSWVKWVKWENRKFLKDLAFQAPMGLHDTFEGYN